jgi:PAS domain S-box-containing protein
MTEVLPNLEKQWLDHFCGVVSTGKEIRFEEYNKDTGRYYDVFCYRPAKGRCAILFRDITDNKRTAEELRQAHALLEGITSSAEDMIAAEDGDFRYLFLNDAYKREFKRLWGQDIEVGTSMVEAMAQWPEEQRRARELWQRALDGESFRVITEFGPSEREKQVYDLRFNPVQDQQGRRIGGAHILRNVTEQVRTQQALRQSEERFRIYADFTYDWEYWINPEGAYIYSSPACEKVTGYGPEHFRDSRQLLALVHPEDREMFAMHLEEHLPESTRLVELEFRIINRRNEERWIAHACQPVYGNDGRYLGRRANNRDITERKDTEQQMKLFIDLIDQSNDGISAVDLRAGRLIVVNEKLCRNLGYTREELLAMRPEDTSTRPAGFFDRHFQELREVGSFLIEDTHRRKDGTTFPVEVSVKYTKVNEREFAVAVIRDISERRRMEQELQKAQKLESIGLLAGGIAHDFNNILTAILGNITLARMFLPPGEKAIARLAVAEQASLRARGLSQQLLTFAKGGAPITETTAVPHLVREAVGLALRGSNVRDEYFFPGDLRPVEADEGQLNQAICNLVLNAVQAMPEGGVLTITAANEVLPAENTLSLLPGDYVRIDITDQGIGIAAELQERIFDPYFTTKERGSGLGLAISFSIIKRHGGTITVDSAPGRGSTFSIFLPASQKRLGAPQAAETEEFVPGTGRILVMDDEKTVSEVAAELLHHLGYRAETVRDGAEAITAYRQALASGEPFDAVITDLTVPAGMGGKETVRRLLEIDPHAKVIVSSGYGNDPIVADFARYGFKGVIPKPYKTAELSRTLQEVLNK